MITNDVKEEYAAFEKKYKLPHYDELNQEFELLYFTNVYEIPFVLRFVRRRMNDRISTFAHTLQVLLHPNPGSFISLEESSFLTDEGKHKASSLLKELMKFTRESTLLDVNFDEKKDAAFIRDAYLFLKNVRGDLYSLLEKVKKGWESQAKEESNEQYFG